MLKRYQLVVFRTVLSDVTLSYKEARVTSFSQSAVKVRYGFLWMKSEWVERYLVEVVS